MTSQFTNLTNEQISACHKAGLEYQFKIANENTLSKYAMYLSNAVNQHNKNEKDKIILELMQISKIKIPKEVYEHDAGTMAFVIGLMGVITDLKYIVNIERAAEIVGLSERQVRRLCEEKAIIAKKIRREWAIDVRSLSNRSDVNETEFLSEEE
ncbi:helix-turn-helix domain-containing protein [Lysinibacillus sphaericus]|uniref:helix-turn-helix domain-containing protein n=1 Tax=Lysinibacillus sphaericus TaxID=1421 RepID=UPI000C1A7269|nr:helix-turn-helix domain-containing protein [Lysinibacillus sphaericus]PIJ95512.1 hypothetical protein CTN02_23565 [Lysinibacillus sphaericus]